MGCVDFSQEYVVEDVDGEMTGSEWLPPPLPAEHVQQLKTLGLLWNEMCQFFILPRRAPVEAWTHHMLLLLSCTYYKLLGTKKVLYICSQICHTLRLFSCMLRMASLKLVIFLTYFLSDLSVWGKGMGTNLNTYNQNWQKSSN